MPKPSSLLTRRSMLAGAAVAAGLLPVLPARAKPRLAYDLRPRPVTRGIWLVEGRTEYFNHDNGGAIVNTIFVETTDGVVVFDTGPSRRYGEALRKVIGETTAKPVQSVFVTHHHPDHWFGNQAFNDVPIHALAKARTLAAQHSDAYADNMYRLVGDWMRGTEPVPPTETILGGDLNIGGRSFHLHALSGHTEADLAVVDQATGTLIAGDLAFLDRAPTTPHADLEDWHRSLQALQALEPAAILCGHGPVDRTGASLDQTQAYLHWLEHTLRNAVERGLDMAEAMQIPLPPDFALLGAQPQEFQRSVSHLFPALEQAALPDR